jgi:hypothetical protein
VDLRRLRAGEWLAGAGGVLLIGSLLLLPWYEADSGEVTGFEVFSIVDILLTLIGGLAIALAFLQATQDSPAMPVGAGVLCVPLGFAGFALVLYRLLDEPGVPGGDAVVDVRLGAYLGLLAMAAITAGGWLSIATEQVRGLPPGPEPELRPAPHG